MVEADRSKTVGRTSLCPNYFPVFVPQKTGKNFARSTLEFDVHPFV